MFRQEIVARIATIDDASNILEWRNDALTRKMFRNSGVIDWEQHIQWLHSISDPNRLLLMCCQSMGTDVGFVWFCIRQKTAEVSINLAPIARGRGLSGKCLIAAIYFLQKERPCIIELTAHVRVKNLASRRLFERLGFVVSKETCNYLYFSLLLDDGPINLNHPRDGFN